MHASVWARWRCPGCGLVLRFNMMRRIALILFAQLFFLLTAVIAVIVVQHTSNLFAALILAVGVVGFVPLALFESLEPADRPRQYPLRGLFVLIAWCATVFGLLGIIWRAVSSVL